nr:probable manganese-transporting ATPase PDR2 [Tanacetum cinerariifolium]
KLVVDIESFGKSFDEFDKETGSFGGLQPKQADLNFVYALNELHSHEIRVVPSGRLSAPERIALSARVTIDKLVSEGRSLDREVVEDGLKFNGLAVFNCPIRGNSATRLSELKCLCMTW